MTLNKFRSQLYKTARILGDVQAVSHKNPSMAISKRIGRRVTGSLFAQIMAMIFPPTR